MAGSAATEERAADPATPTTSGRVRSLDVARGLVIIQLLLSDIVFADRDFAAHADWWGFTAYDLIFPAFLLLFGASLAIALRRGVRWPRLARRTAVLLVAGLAFNAVVAWNPNPAELRLTGVLQLFAVVGVVVIAITRPARRWWQALVAAGLLLVAHHLVLAGVGAGCPSGLPEPGCNPSAVDAAVFGEAHLYHGMERGHDPEGLGVLPGAVATALLGYAAGRVLWERRKVDSRELRRDNALVPLAGIAAACLALAPLAATAIPVSKRLWTPSLVLLTAGMAIGALAVCHLVFDVLPRLAPAADRPLLVAGWIPEAYGRNSLLMYFGFYAVGAVLANAGVQPVGPTLHEWEAGIGAWVCPALELGFWTALAAVLHVRGRYLTA